MKYIRGKKKYKSKSIWKKMKTFLKKQNVESKINKKMQIYANYKKMR